MKVRMKLLLRICCRNFIPWETMKNSHNKNTYLFPKRIDDFDMKAYNTYISISFLFLSCTYSTRICTM